MEDSIIFCEGESEKIFLDSSIDLGYLRMSKKNIKILTNKNKLCRAKSIFPGYKCYYLFHDTDNIVELKQWLKDVENVLGDSFVLIKTHGNMEFFIAEMCGRNNKPFSKTEHINVKNFLVKIFKKSKKISLHEIEKKNECSIGNIKNHEKFEILKILDIV